MRNLCDERRGTRILCLYYHHRKLMADLLDSIGGFESSGICSEHEDYAVWHANQPPTEEEIARRKEFEERKAAALEQVRRMTG